MKRFTRYARTLIVFVMLFAGLAGTSGLRAGAQSLDVDPNLFVSELTDFEIEITGNEFQIYEAELQEYTHGEGEVVQISSTSSQVQVAFFDDTDTSEETLEIYNSAFSEDVDGFEILDEGGRRGTVYSFAVADYNDVQFLYYVSVTEDVDRNVDLLQQMYAPASSFIEEFEAAQDAITIDGDGFLENVDIRDLEDLIDVPAPRDDDPEETEEVEPDTTPEEGRGTGTRGSLNGETYEFELLDAEITLTDEVTVSNVLLEEPAVEQVQLQVSSSGSVGAIQMMQLPMNSEGVLDSLLANFSSGTDSLENLGTDADRSSAWSLDIGVLNGQETVIYIWVDESRYDDFHYIELLIAPETTFISDLQILNENVEIDGVAMYEDSDIDQLESLLDGDVLADDDDTGNASDRDDTNAKPDTDDTDDGDDRNVRDDDEDDDTGTGTDTDTETNTNTDALDLESQGLVSDTEFESLQHGFTVEWDQDVWEIDPEWELSAVSDTSNGVDSVIMFRVEGGASILIQIMPSDGQAPDDFLDLWESEEYILDSVHEDAEVLLSDSGRDTAAVIYLTYDSDGEELGLVQEVIDLDGGDTVAVITMFGSTEAMADAYADAEDFVTVGDEDAVGTFTPREIETALEP